MSMTAQLARATAQAVRDRKVPIQRERVWERIRQNAENGFMAAGFAIDEAVACVSFIRDYHKEFTDLGFTVSELDKDTVFICWGL